MQLIQFHDLAFDPDMLFARRGDGSEIRFTRQERAILLQLAKQPGKLQTRDKLIEFVARDGYDASERNVDFLVNRLRKRLGDSARNPRFIATQYGEGYIWIAQPRTGDSSSPLLVIGPVYGLSASGPRADEALGSLTEALEALLGRDRGISCVPRFSAHDAVGSERPFYSLDVSFHNDRYALHAAFVLRHLPSAAIIGAFRYKFEDDRASDAVSPTAERIKTALWAHLACPSGPVVAPAELPLEIRMHDAARLLIRSPMTWRETEKQLIEARAADPDDPTLAIMWGLNLYARLLQHAADAEGPMPQTEWAMIEDEIEALALANLPKVGDNPLLVLAVAKLLFFIDRGHAELAARLAEDAFATSTAFAASFALQGQICACQGRIGEALSLYDQGIEMSEPGSEFHVYLIVLKVIALLALGDRAPLDRVVAELYTLRPLTRMQFGLMLSPPSPELPADLAPALAALDEARARNLIHYFFNVCARRFTDPQHRRNVMLGLLTHMVRRFGPGIVPASVGEALELGGDPVSA